MEQHGLAGSALYIDTESTFRPERVAQIAKARDLDVESILNNIHVAKIYNASHLELIVRAMGSLIQQNNIKLVIVDSIISLHRAEFVGRGTLSERQQKLNAIMHRLKRVAEIYNVAVIITNQVQSTPDTFFGDPTKGCGRQHHWPRVHIQNLSEESRTGAQGDNDRQPHAPIWGH